MKTSSKKRKIAESLVGAAAGAVVAGPAGAVVGGLAGRQVAARTPPPEKAKRKPQAREAEADDPIIHAQLRRILVPLDFSPPSLHALRFAREWAGRFGSEVCLLHVLEPMSTAGLVVMEPIALPPPPPDLHAEARTELEKLAHREFPEATKVSVYLRDGIAWDQIANAAKELRADVIILATHGRTGLAHALVGSTAERVVRHAPCPVLTLRRALVPRARAS